VTEAIKPSWIYCNACKHHTRHILVASQKYNDSPGLEEGGPETWGEYRLWACAGCDTCTMENYYSTSFMLSDEGDEIYESIYYPTRASSNRPSKHFMNLPAKLGTLYSEVVKSKNEGLYLLCAAGLRSLLEGVCADKGIDGRNLEKKIDAMKSLLPESIVKNLHGFRFIGNRAVHELEAPKGYELNIAIDVIEDILNFLYALDYKANLFAKTKAAQREVAQEAATAAAPAERSSAMPAQDPSDTLDG
jgi:Domain of unknown function (DUF4145)